MKIGDLPLNDVFRFLITGYVLYIVALYTGMDQLLEKVRMLEPIERQLAIFTAGVLVFYFYRTGIYPIVLRIMDYLNKENVRTFIRQNDQVASWSEANDIYLLISNRNPEMNVDNNRIWSHSIHMLFITGILFLIGFLFTLLQGDFCTNWMQILAFGVISSFLLLAAFGSESSLEKRIYRSFVVFYRPKFESEIGKYLSNKKG